MRMISATVAICLVFLACSPAEAFFRNRVVQVRKVVQVQQVQKVVQVQQVQKIVKVQHVQQVVQPVYHVAPVFAPVVVPVVQPVLFYAR